MACPITLALTRTQDFNPNCNPNLQRNCRIIFPIHSQTYAHTHPEGDSLAAGATGQKTWDNFENENVAGANPDVVRSLSQRVIIILLTTTHPHVESWGNYYLTH